MTGVPRIIFIVINVVLIINLCLCEKRKGIRIQLSHKDRGMNVNYLNDLRRDVKASDMRELEWDPVLAGHARRWGRKCVFDESKKDKAHGQLLYREYYDPTTRPGEIIMNSIRAWAMQKQNYTRRSWKNCQRSETCDYIQMISSSTNTVGCAVTRCPTLKTGSSSGQSDMVFVVCFTNPRLPLQTKPYTPGRRCTQCPEDLSCRKRLCSDRSKKRGRPTKQKKLPSSKGISLREKYRQYLDKLKKKSSSKSKKISSNTQSSLPQVSIRVSSHEIKEASQLQSRYLDDKGQVRIKSISSSENSLQRDRPDIVVPPSPSSRGKTKGISGSGIPPAPKSNRVKRQVYDPYAVERERRRQERLRAERERQRRERERQRQEQIRREEERRRQEEARARQLRERRRRQDEYERELERRRRLRQEQQRRRYRDPYAPQQIRQLGGLEQTDKYHLEQVHNTLRRAEAMREMKWDNYLEKWAKYVIRCDIEYPGPIDCYTNFGKIDRNSEVYNMVYDWGAEGNDVTRSLRYGCRTPADIERCNHNSIVRHVSLRRFGCASLDCGSMRQLTCVYK